VLVGLGAGSLVGILLGYLMGTRPWARDILEPVVELVRPVPPLAWIPLAILWLGIGLADQAFIIFLGCVFPILLNTYEGVRAIEPRYLEVSRVFGADDSTTWRRVVVPATLPHVLTGLRVGAGVAWMCLVAAELQGVRTGYGLGYMMVVAQDLARADRIMVGMVSIGVLGYLMNRGMRGLEGRFVPWR
jgi:ABC-type nitrate/sulfonate/bicarbonate transport system permease component